MTATPQPVRTRPSSALALLGAAVLVAGAVFPGAPVSAATVERVAVAHSGARYTVTMRVRVDISASEAFAVMTDYPNLPEVNPNMIEAEPLADDRLRTVVSMCVGFFCKKVEQVQSVSAQANTRLNMRVLPAQSDLRFGEASWRFESLDTKRSRIVFRAEIEPDFWVPPVVGSWLIQDKLKTQAIETSKGIEREARERRH